VGFSQVGTSVLVLSERLLLTMMMMMMNCLRNAGGTPMAAASSCVTDFFRDVFVERKTFAFTFRVAVRYPCVHNNGNHA